MTYLEICGGRIFRDFPQISCYIENNAELTHVWFLQNADRAWGGICSVSNSN